MPVPNYVTDPTIPPGPIRPRKDGALAVVDDFEIIRPLGAGGFGTVYLAKDTTSDIEVALKVIGKDRKSAFGSFGWKTLPKGSGDPAGLEDELRENFKLIHGLTHPHIAAAYPLHLVRSVKKLGDGVFIVAGDILSVMAYAPGVTLDKWRLMFDGGCVPPRDAADIIAQIADALACAHGQGIIHRDVKPSNVMVDTMEGGKPFVRLLDFGLATKIGGEAGEVCGTPQYMSPEQWTGRVQDAGTDQYSLAVLACELLTGHVPFENVFKCGDLEVMRIAVSTRYGDVPAGIGARTRSVLLRGLAKSPTDRYRSCSEFADVLARSCGRKSKRMVSVFCWVAILALLVAGLVFVLLIRAANRLVENTSFESYVVTKALPERFSSTSNDPPAQVSEPVSSNDPPARVAEPVSSNVLPVQVSEPVAPDVAVLPESVATPRPEDHRLVDAIRKEAMEKVEACRRIGDADGFRALKDECEAAWRRAEEQRGTSPLDVAAAGYTGVVERVARIVRLDEDRQRAITSRRKSEDARRCAIGVGAKEHAKARFAEAERHAHGGAKAFADMDFLAARNDCAEAAKLFEEATVEAKNRPQPCPKCHGHGTVVVDRVCDRCQGKGREPCRMCGPIRDKRTGKVVCEHGVRCDVCDGTGRRKREGFLSIFIEPCSDCVGEGWTKHTKCQGSGFLAYACNKCRGKERISEEVACPLCGKNNKGEKQE